MSGVVISLILTLFIQSLFPIFMPWLLVSLELHTVRDLSLRPFVCPFVSSWTLFFENEGTDFNADWHKLIFAQGPGQGHEWSTLAVMRSKIKVTGSGIYVWKLDGESPLNRVDTGVHERRKCCLCTSSNITLLGAECCIFLTAPRVCRICVLLTHLF